MLVICEMFRFPHLPRFPHFHIRSCRSPQRVLDDDSSSRAAARRDPCARRPVRRRGLGRAPADPARARAGRRADGRRRRAPEPPAPRRGGRRRRGVLRGARRARWACRSVAERTDVAALARAQKRSIEDAARAARYAFFERAAAALGARTSSPSRTRSDDQAETFLLRLLRGAGTRGLAAIQPRGAGQRRAAAARRSRATSCAPTSPSRGQAFREDSSNADVTIPRNRLRHELIPYLESHFSPAVTDVLARDAALARQDEDFLHGEAIKLAARIVLTDVAVRIDAAGLSSAPRALSSRVVQAALQRLAGSKPISFDHVEQVLALADGPGEGRAVSLPGQYAVRAGGDDRALPSPGARAAERRSAESELFRVFAVYPWRGRARPPAAGGRRGAGSLPRRSGTRRRGPWRRIGRPSQWAGRGTEVGVAAGALALPLAVRSRRPGDRFRPLGAPGGRKLQDFLVDRKVARDERDTRAPGGRRARPYRLGRRAVPWRRTFASRTPHKACYS